MAGRNERPSDRTLRAAAEDVAQRAQAVVKEVAPEVKQAAEGSRRG
ncbi:MAG: hypothetical protein IPM07_13710 [Anaerolineales bacterium]|nr:hypothetical protein [Anaerolineales bacterium]